jgi:RNA polymerase sigma-70 factor (ECF subfamily)
VAGDKPPFEELYTEYFTRVYAFLRALLGNAEDAEDVTSQVFIKAYHAYGRYQPQRATPASWLFQIARNAALDHHRRSARRDRLDRRLASQPVVHQDPSEVAAERILYREILGALDRLPHRQREVVGLRHSGLSFLEVGDLMACSEDAAKMLYYRALRSLRASLPADPP